MSMKYWTVSELIKKLQKAYRLKVTLGFAFFGLITIVGYAMLFAFSMVKRDASITLKVVSILVFLLGVTGASLCGDKQTERTRERREKILSELESQASDLGIKTREDVTMLQNEIKSTLDSLKTGYNFVDSISCLVFSAVLIPTLREIVSQSFLSDLIQALGSLGAFQDPDVLLTAIMVAIILFVFLVVFLRISACFTNVFSRTLSHKYTVYTYLEDLKYMFPENSQGRKSQNNHVSVLPRRKRFSVKKCLYYTSTTNE